MIFLMPFELLRSDHSYPEFAAQGADNAPPCFLCALRLDQRVYFCLSGVAAKRTFPVARKRDVVFPSKGRRQPFPEFFQGPVMKQFQPVPGPAREIADGLVAHPLKIVTADKTGFFLSQRFQDLVDGANNGLIVRAAFSRPLLPGQRRVSPEADDPILIDNSIFSHSPSSAFDVVSIHGWVSSCPPCDHRK